jgi:hypothetical protein
MNTHPAPFFNETIPFFKIFKNTGSYQNKEVIISCSQVPVAQPICYFKSNLSMMNDGKPPADDEFGIGGGAKSNMVPLSLDFVPGIFDVLCGRGKKNYNSSGTQH